jgi:hypothetical protein
LGQTVVDVIAKRVDGFGVSYLSDGRGGCRGGSAQPLTGEEQQAIDDQEDRSRDRSAQRGSEKMLKPTGSTRPSLRTQTDAGDHRGRVTQNPHPQRITEQSGCVVAANTYRQSGQLDRR